MQQAKKKLLLIPIFIFAHIVSKKYYLRSSAFLLGAVFFMFHNYTLCLFGLKNFALLLRKLAHEAFINKCTLFFILLLYQYDFYTPEQQFNVDFYFISIWPNPQRTHTHLYTDLTLKFDCLKNHIDCPFSTFLVLFLDCKKI